MPLTKRKLWLLIILLALLFLRALYVAWLGPPVITIANESAGEVTGVVLRGEDFEKAVGSIGPGGSKAVVVRPPNESGLDLRFVASGKEYVRYDLAYIEAQGGYCTTFTIDDQLKVRRLDDGVFCFSLRRAILLW